MSIEKAVSLGLAGNEISKKITGSTDVCASRSAVATGAGAALGATATGLITVAGVTAAAPVIIPVTIAAGAVSFVASLFD